MALDPFAEGVVEVRVETVVGALLVGQLGLGQGLGQGWGTDTQTPVEADQELQKVAVELKEKKKIFTYCKIPYINHSLL